MRNDSLSFEFGLTLADETLPSEVMEKFGRKAHAQSRVSFWIDVPAEML